MQAVIEAMEAVVQTMSEAAGPKRNKAVAMTASMSAGTSGSSLKQPTFNWKDKNEYNELLNFEMEVKIFS